MGQVYQLTPKAEALSASVPKSFGTLPTAGRGIAVAAYAWGSATPTAGAVTDNQGNTYTLVTSASNGGSVHLTCAIWACAAIATPSGTFTLTINMTGASVLVGGALECDALVLPVDKTASNTGTSGTITSGTTVATTQADELLIAVMSELNGTTVTIANTAGFTILMTEPDNGAFQQGEGDYKIQAATGTQSSSWTDTGSGGWVGAIAALKFAAPAARLWPGLQVRQAVNRASTY